MWQLSDGNCPNYIEGWWKPTEGTPVLIFDCAPKRTLFMVQELISRQIGVEKSLEEQRNSNITVVEVFKQTAMPVNKTVKLKTKEDIIDVDFE